MIHLSDWFGLAVVLALFVLIGFQRTKKSKDFLVAGRSVGLFALVATLVMTEFNTSTLLAFSSMGYLAGPMAIALPFVFLVGLGWYTISVAKHWKRYNGLSVAGFFTKRYGPLLGKLASLFLLLAMTGFSSTYVKSMTLIFMPWFSIHIWVLSGLLCVLVLVMTLSGGLLSVIRADILSFILTCVLFPSLLVIGYLKFNGMQALERVFVTDQLVFSPWAQWNHPALPFWFVTTLIILTVFTYICSPWYGQKIFAAKDEKTAFWAVGISSVLVFILYGAALLAASFFKLQNGSLVDAQMVVPAMINSWLPPVVKGIAYAVLFSAAMTTLAGVWSTMVAMMVADFNFDKSSIGSQRLYTVCLALCCWLGANLLVDNILNRLILANIPIAALSFALLAGFYWKGASRVGAWLSMVIGLLWGAGCFMVLGDAGGYTWYWAIYGIPLIFGSGILGSLLYPNKVTNPLTMSKVLTENP